MILQIKTLCSQIQEATQTHMWLHPNSVLNTDCLNHLPATKKKWTALKLEEQALYALAILCSPLPASHSFLHWLSPFLGPFSKCYSVPTHMFVYIYTWIRYNVGSTCEGQLVRFRSSHLIYFLSKSVILKISFSLCLTNTPFCIFITFSLSLRLSMDL